MRQDKKERTSGFVRYIGIFIGVVLLAVTATSQAFAADFYVTSNGSSSGAGTQQSPWDLPTALNKTTVVTPGSTVWVDEGTYKGPFTVNLQGAANQYVTIKAIPGKRVTLDGGIKLNKEWVTLWGFEIMSSNPNRISATTDSSDLKLGPGIYATPKNIRVINNIIHDMVGDGLVSYSTGPATTDPQLWYGNLVYNVGYKDATRFHGHDIYSHNDNNGLKTFANNILLKSADVNVQVGSYPGTAPNSGNRTLDYTFQNNVNVDGRFLIGGYNIADNINVIENYFYQSIVDLGYVSGSKDNGTANFEKNYVHLSNKASFLYWNNLTVKDNTFLAATAQPINLNTWGKPLSGYNWNSNHYHFTNPSTAYFTLKTVLASVAQNLSFSGWKTATAFDSTTSPVNQTVPTVPKVVVLPNAYETQRAHIVVYNWAGDTTVTVNVSSLSPRMNQQFLLRNAFNYYDETQVITYAGSPVTIPMTGWTSAEPNGMPAFRASPYPNFGVFVIEPMETPTQTASCKGDLNGDQTVNLSDYSLFLSVFLKPVSLKPAADLNADSQINLSDYSIFLNRFLKPCQ